MKKKYKLINTQYIIANSKDEALEMLLENINDFSTRYQFKVVESKPLSKKEQAEEDKWQREEELEDVICQCEHRRGEHHNWDRNGKVGRCHWDGKLYGHKKGKHKGKCKCKKFKEIKLG